MTDAPLFTPADVTNLRAYAESASAGSMEDFNDGMAATFLSSLADRLERYLDQQASHAAYVARIEAVFAAPITVADEMELTEEG